MEHVINSEEKRHKQIRILSIYSNSDKNICKKIQHFYQHYFVFSGNQISKFWWNKGIRNLRLKSNLKFISLIIHEMTFCWKIKCSRWSWLLLTFIGPQSSWTLPTLSTSGLQLMREILHFSFRPRRKVRCREHPLSLQSLIQRRVKVSACVGWAGLNVKRCICSIMVGPSARRFFKVRKQGLES